MAKKQRCMIKSDDMKMAKMEIVMEGAECTITNAISKAFIDNLFVVVSLEVYYSRHITSCVEQVLAGIGIF